MRSNVKAAHQVQVGNAHPLGTERFRICVEETLRGGTPGARTAAQRKRDKTSAISSTLISSAVTPPLVGTRVGRRCSVGRKP